MELRDQLCAEPHRQLLPLASTRTGKLDIIEDLNKSNLKVTSFLDRYHQI